MNLTAVNNMFHEQCIEQRNAAWAEINDLKRDLTEACSIIERLADQQAMPDDFYVEPLARLRQKAL